MISAANALIRLKNGNKQFAAQKLDREKNLNASRRYELLDGQEPFAIILGCADSRVPAELVFNQGLGDLFVIRVAGNIVAPSQIGSVEFAAEKFATPLVVVLGHTQCGAVIATVEELIRPKEKRSANLQSIVGRIQPAVEPLLQNSYENRDQLVNQAVRENIFASVKALKRGSEILRDLIAREQLHIVGAEYSLATGRVEFFENG